MRAQLAAQEVPEPIISEIVFGKSPVCAARSDCSSLKKKFNGGSTPAGNVFLASERVSS
jgi:hypothetical protein